MTKRASINLDAEFNMAWNHLWSQNLKWRDKSYNPASTYYLTASDLERRVREQLIQRTGHYRVRISTTSGSLLNAARDWLSTQTRSGRFEMTTLGKGHISGARFRPRGAPMHDAEMRTMKQRATPRTKPRPMHFGTSSPTCTRERKRAMYSRSRAHCTTLRWHVTCPTCLKVMPKCTEVEFEAMLKRYDAAINEGDYRDAHMLCASVEREADRMGYSNHRRLRALHTKFEAMGEAQDRAP